jgi:thiol-disulfide isomerase/thioredoxin
VQPTRWQIKAAFLAAVLFLLAGTSSAQDEIPGLSVTLTRLEQPLPAPDFILKDMDDEPHALQDYRGKVVLINFWATWCPPCRKEMPSLEHLYQKFSDQPFTVLAINQWEDADHVFAYMGDLNVFPSFPILFDPDSTVSADYGVRGLPTSFIIDPEGKIIYKAVGGRKFDHPAIVQLIRALLEKL